MSFLVIELCLIWTLGTQRVRTFRKPASCSHCLRVSWLHCWKAWTNSLVRDTFSPGREMVPDFLFHTILSQVIALCWDELRLPSVYKESFVLKVEIYLMKFASHKHSFVGDDTRQYSKYTRTLMPCWTRSRTAAWVSFMNVLGTTLRPMGMTLNWRVLMPILNARNFLIVFFFFNVIKGFT